MNDATADPGEALYRLWQAGPPPDLETFLARVGPLAPPALAAVLRVDQGERWRTGHPVPAEMYFHLYPAVEADPDAALDLVYAEFLLADGPGGRGQLSEFARRFPALAAGLRDQVELHRAVAGRADTSPPGRTQPAAGDRQGGSALPEQFGRYHILRELGRGGMGTVYLAHDAQLDRRVALKVPRLEDDPAQVRRFLREARAAAALQHPHICPVFDSGQIDGRCYLTMAYIEGESLAAEVARGPLPVAAAVAVARALAGALAEVHAHGVIHRDLKPANVLRDGRGEPVLTDFGLAKRVDAGATSGSLSGDGVIVGTPAYMAPEQVRGTDEVGPATDMYGLGAILYELLTGGPPFTGSLARVLVRVTTEMPDPPSVLRPGVGPQLDAVCLTVLAKRPADRFPSMAAFVAALDGEPSPVRGRVLSRSEPGPARGSARPHPAGLWVAAAGVVVLVGGGVLTWWPWSWRPDTPSNDPRPTVVVVRDPEAADDRATRAWALNDRGETDAALRESDQALALDDRCVKALICRANALIKKKDFDAALAALDRADAADPTNALASIGRAWAHNNKGTHDQALVAADRAIGLQGDAWEAHYQRGWANAASRRPKEAVADFTRALQHQPDYVWAYRHRAQAYQALGQEALAAQDLAAAAQLDAFAVGSQWTGAFSFRHIKGHRRELQLAITGRDGDTFRGTYTTEENTYQWEIRGTVAGERVRWEFTKAVRGVGADHLVGQGTVEGTVRDGVIQAAFHDPTDNSRADMTLRRKKD